MSTTTEYKLPALLTPRPQASPDDDGRTHINISSTGATELGRQLTHFAFTPFIHPIYGHFKTMEGFWHYIKSEDPDDAFRSMTGGKAKAYAKTKRTVKRPNFIDIIKEANFCKIEQTVGLKELMVASSLPFEYYYLYGPEQVRISPGHAVWLRAMFEEIRQVMKAGQRVEQQKIVDFSQRAEEWFRPR